MSPSARRHALGIVALLLLAAAAALHLGFSPGLDDNLAKFYRDMCLRVAMTLGAAWLAFAQIMALTAYCSPRLLFALALGGVLLIAQPKARPIVAILIGAVLVLEVLGWLLKPLRPPGKRPKQ